MFVWVQPRDFVTDEMVRTGLHLKTNANLLGSLKVARLAYLLDKLERIG